MIRRVFVANRGEIAVRIINACHALGVETVLGVSTADRDTLGAQLADQTLCIGPPPAMHSYLKMQSLVHAAVHTDCDALHPGYGFLAERAEFQRLCSDNGLIFIGPSAENIEMMGDKLRAREIAEEAGIPVIPGSEEIHSITDALRFGEIIGYPLLLKASAGGGGRGMRLVRDGKELKNIFDSARAEAGNTFGNPSLYLEKYRESARHIEVQIMADSHGRVVHFAERDCSIQRRYQKLLEEAPSPSVDSELRDRMTNAAVRLVSHINYLNAGTVEFILDPERKDFYFLEMNTRIQVEHPVTEMVTGADLVAEQIRVASGERLSLRQEEISTQGHAIECRINAEIPEAGFQPSPGRISQWYPPNGENVRLDSHCYLGYTIPPYYDSMIGKLIVRGSDRTAAVDTMLRALGEFVVGGIHTTIPFHKVLIKDEDFHYNRTSTKWVEDTFMKRWRS